MKCPIDRKECPKERTESSLDGDPNCLGIQVSRIDRVEHEMGHLTFKQDKYIDYDLMPQCPRFDFEKANKILKTMEILKE